MVSFNPLHPLQSSILELLAVTSDISVDELRKALKKQKQMQPSVATIYRILKELEDEQVIVRSRGRMQLNAVWISHIARFAEKARALQNSNRRSERELRELRPGSRMKFVAESLMDLDPIWNHTLLELVRIEKKQEWCMYNSHPWYSLGMQATETRLYEGLINEGISPKMLYGNTSFLDRYGMKMIQVKGMTSSLSDACPLPKSGYAAWICGDTIVDCVFPESINMYFDHFFTAVKSIDQFQPSLFADVFRMKAHCTLNVRREKTEAEKLRRIISEYY